MSEGTDPAPPRLRPGPRRWWTVASAVAAVALAGYAVADPGHLPLPPGPWLQPSGSAAPPAVGGVGAAGIGDPYYPLAGNGGYDVGDYDLALTYDPGTRQLTGHATITATATVDLTSFDLDFRGLPISAVTVNGAAAGSQAQENGELVVTPATPLTAGGGFTTVVDYAGVPQPYEDPALGEVGFLTSADGAVAIGEPQVAASWYPVNDHPRDKATYTIRISAPTGLAALSNGVLVSQTPADRPGYTTWTWRVSAPMASYLATMVVGDYRVVQETHDGLPVVLAVQDSLPTSIDDELAHTPAIVDWLQTVFGPYPFDAIGGIVVADDRVQFALENQTRPIYGKVFFGGGGDEDWVLVHELAHQWYGDSVSVDDWREIWLNEGFATYAEWLWDEHQGYATAQGMFDGTYENADPELWAVPPANLGLDHLFGSPGSEYTRGAMALHALRVTVGDDAFFRILREWAAQRQGGTGTTAQFEALAEQVSGQPLDTLFQDWLYGTTRPPRP